MGNFVELGSSRSSFLSIVGRILLRGSVGAITCNGRVELVAVAISHTTIPDNDTAIYVCSLLSSSVSTIECHL